MFYILACQIGNKSLHSLGADWNLCWESAVLIESAHGVFLVPLGKKWYSALK
jgi:hypothetical protein